MREARQHAAQSLVARRRANLGVENMADMDRNSTFASLLKPSQHHWDNGIAIFSFDLNDDHQASRPTKPISTTRNGARDIFAMFTGARHSGRVGLERQDPGAARLSWTSGADLGMSRPASSRRRSCSSASTYRRGRCNRPLNMDTRLSMRTPRNAGAERAVNAVTGRRRSGRPHRRD